MPNQGNSQISCLARWSAVQFSLRLIGLPRRVLLPSRDHCRNITIMGRKQDVATLQISEVPRTK